MSHWTLNSPTLKKSKLEKEDRIVFHIYICAKQTLWQSSHSATSRGFFRWWTLIRSRKRPPLKPLRLYICCNWRLHSNLVWNLLTLWVWIGTEIEEYLLKIFLLLQCHAWLWPPLLRHTREKYRKNKSQREKIKPCLSHFNVLRVSWWSG